MSTKGTAAKSASGAAMSKYDVEVESRLQALESKALPQQDGGGSVDSAKLEELWQWYQQAKKHV
jgi:hypothetical protein|tara:strand:- start:342 stop:533 length:192 start_codon:yes stop_codon:yes gene_type:complete